MPDNRPVINLTCSCCDGPATGRQWWNRDIGEGLCPKCAVWIAGRETPKYMHDTYGVEGVHYFKKDGVNNG